ncbi:L-seryl-tRNA(Sec) selenium transferase [Wansuia hejianensis]|uniref:L-seryl-tRNA(Sec) selenium transferase n=1 Tax=Wansuia hejianensis TaxID=2763667 RepID=A0A926INL2_9FIRM|nr:L-seryl-tRNA(Sec) selenium transferase [Wansuia hejianensis]
MNKQNLFAFIPKVDELLEDNKIKELLELIPRKLVIDSIREELDGLRNKIKIQSIDKNFLEEEIKALPNKVYLNALNKDSLKLKRVVNGSGVIIHTNLGRSLLNEDIINNIKEVATNYSNLEYNLDKGERGSRYDHLEYILQEITGGESAMVVNNNAAAVILVLSTLAKDKEVIVSRGELIEIGGSFRIPDVMEQSGAHLVSVGTTNKTHLYDYENAIGEETGALLKVHTSNYCILGFTSTVESKELNSLKDKYNIPLVEDLGSGVLIDLSKYGLEYEPTVQDSLKNGVDIVTFSGDKLLGGPQAGIIVGKKEYIDAMKRNPLTRAFRVDKFTIAALEATLKYYLDENRAIKEIPTLKMLTMTMEEINNNAIDLCNKIKELNLGSKVNITIEESYAEVGGGSLPLEKLPTKCTVLSFDELSTDAFERGLRNHSTPIITRLYRNRIYIDLRTVRREEFPIILAGIESTYRNLEGV